jgi:hypothetical protein
VWLLGPLGTFGQMLLMIRNEAPVGEWWLLTGALGIDVVTPQPQSGAEGRGV